jgi:hypothetical protein
MMWTIAENIVLSIARRMATEDPWYDGFSKPVGQRLIEESIILDEIGGPYLEPSL